MKRHHLPQRTCLGCSCRDDQQKMLRLTVGENGELKVDRLGRGRGGYLHKSESCWGAFIRKKNFNRTFRMEVELQAREKLIRTLRDQYWE